MNSLQCLHKPLCFCCLFSSQVVSGLSSFTSCICNNFRSIRVTLPSVKEVQLLTTHRFSQTSLHKEVAQSVKDTLLCLFDCKRTLHITCLLSDVRNLTSQRSCQICLCFFSIHIDIVVKIFLDCFHASVKTFVSQDSSLFTKPCVFFFKLTKHKLEPTRVSLWISEQLS